MSIFTNKKIAVVVVTYNRLNLLKDCINAIRSQTTAYEKLIVVNNGSTDETPAWLDSQGDLDVIHQKNVGSAGGFYTGVKYACEKEYDYIWLMDDDVMVSATALENLQEGLNITGDFSFGCSKVISKDGVFINAPNIDDKMSAYNYPVWGQFAEHGIIRVKNATFVSVFINAAYLQQAGLPAKDFFIWGDDMDFTYRLSRVAPGYFIGNSIATHFRADPSFPSILTEKDERRISMHYFNVRNNLYISRKYKSKKEMLLDVLHCWKIIFYCLFLQKGLKKAGIYLKGFWAGLFFNPPVIYPNQKL
ncbi:glycosyltransferase family 2 protein [Foetidibacter luteolus]|uniref:glycosyltransferase family 2 protein n=1 Tax=Foetidibacter luteolus TaxID=2608880 RepID=UPI00129BC82B|nr:glycosyltransferase family 2 protein [Foetidibacter luteolus]